MAKKTEFDDIFKKKIKTEPAPNSEIGIDLDDTFVRGISASNDLELLYKNDVENFYLEALTRDRLYAALDSMALDSIIAAALEIYAEDITETNPNGLIVWVESADENAAKYIEFLLKSMRIDKHIYNWALSLCKYGDLYLRLYRESDVKDDLINSILSRRKKDTKSLNESKIIILSPNDHLINYVEMIPNPAEIFELTRLGKTCAYIKTDITSSAMLYQMNDQVLNTVTSSFTNMYKFHSDDVDIYQPTEFVHACLEDGISRVPETVEIFISDPDKDKEEDKDPDNPIVGLKEKEEIPLIYSVRRGQSLLYNCFKIWRQLTLLEDSVLLNRLTRSSIIRIVGVNVGDMPKEQVRLHLQRLKQYIELRAAINDGISMTEYTNPGPYENIIYVPIHGETGQISVSELGGGDMNVALLADLEYFRNKLYGALRIPKLYLGVTEDATGFNGGTALSIVSSRYAKTVKRLQNTILQALTDLINLILIDKDMHGYVNKFTLRMQEPTTQEELDRRNALQNEIGNVRDLAGLFTDNIESAASKLKIMRELAANIVQNNNVLLEIDRVIEKLEAAENPKDENGEGGDTGASGGDDFGGGFDFGGGGDDFGGGFDLGGGDTGSDTTDLGGSTEEAGGGESLDFGGGAEAGGGSLDFGGGAEAGSAAESFTHNGNLNPLVENKDSDSTDDELPDLDSIELDFVDSNNF